MSSSPTVPLFIAILIQITLGLGVFSANPKRASNQCFLLLCLIIACWLYALHVTFTAQGPGIAEFSIRQASVAGAGILTLFNFLRLSIRERRSGWPGILNHSRTWLVITVAVVIFCQTRWFLTGVRMPSGNGLDAPMPIYGIDGIAGWVYGAYFVGGLLSIFLAAARDMRFASGNERIELGFILIGGVSTIAAALVLAEILDVVVGPSKSILLAPFRAFLFTAVIGYGIATKKVMEVNVLVRRMISYTLLAGYLLGVYAAVWWILATFLDPYTTNAHSIAHVISAMVIAFAMAPARGVSQRLAERLFISSHRLDFRETVRKAAAILKSVTTLGDLLERFAQTIKQALSAERVVILLAQKEAYQQQYPAPTRESRIDLPNDHAIINYLKSSGQPIILDELHRIRPTQEIHRIISQMRHLNLSVVMGIFARDEIEGLMLLGPRLSGRIYGSVEQEALQVLCGQLAVAIENAELFTEVQNAKIYNETLLENLTTGVIAAGTDERITVFNNEAGEITATDPENLINQSIDELTEPLSDTLRATLRSGEREENTELVLRFGDRGIVVRASTSIFHGEDGQVLGALMVLTDITALKRLEMQIRRSDRLASLGTLSAGMAHEIKNPLVSIKTFAQLLPERYQDSDFRETFSNLIGHEIDRIDSLVNQLLRFARPAKPLLKPAHVHEILEKSLTLVGHRLYQKDIKLTKSWEANVDTIRADPDQLEQVFLNFFINAMDAMKNGGQLTVSTETGSDSEWAGPLGQSNGESPEALRITIRDSGEGIKSEDLPHVFDPFFTTKDYGTGLGLSVVHGIVQEHGGQIEVESELHKGTAFHIFLPLVRFDSEVAAA